MFGDAICDCAYCGDTDCTLQQGCETFIRASRIWMSIYTLIKHDTNTMSPPNPTPLPHEPLLPFPFSLQNTASNSPNRRRCIAILAQRQRLIDRSSTTNRLRAGSISKDLASDLGDIESRSTNDREIQTLSTELSRIRHRNGSQRNFSLYELI